MVKECEQCKLKYNDETVDKCPQCNFNRSGRFLPKQMDLLMKKYLNNEHERMHHINPKYQ